MTNLMNSSSNTHNSLHMGPWSATLSYFVNMTVFCILMEQLICVNNQRDAQFL